MGYLVYKIKNKVRAWSHKNKVFNRLYSLANFAKVNSLRFLNDEAFAKLKYKENTGKKLNLDPPVTFNEKLWWLKINNRDPLMTVCSDKVKVRDYVKGKGLESILVPLIGVYEKASEIDFESLPDRAFIKTNHGSGANRIWDKSRSDVRQKIIKSFNKSLRQNYYLQSREWNYKKIVPKIIVEEELKVDGKVGLLDYRFFCFAGKVKLLFVDAETASKNGTHNPGAKRNIYDRDFKLLEVKAKRDSFDEKLVPKPENYEKMVEYAEILSSPFVFCRVDLYNVNGKIYFGEITFYPGGGTQIFEPYEFEKKLGSWIDLDSDKIKLAE